MQYFFFSYWLSYYISKKTKIKIPWNIYLYIFLSWNLIIIESAKLKRKNKMLASGIYLIKTHFTYASLRLRNHERISRLFIKASVPQQAFWEAIVLHYLSTNDWNITLVLSFTNFYKLSLINAVNMYTRILYFFIFFIFLEIWNTYKIRIQKI